MQRGHAGPSEVVEVDILILTWRWCCCRVTVAKCLVLLARTSTRNSPFRSGVHIGLISSCLACLVAAAAAAAAADDDE